jgi:CRISPR-associated protein Csx3
MAIQLASFNHRTNDGVPYTHLRVVLEDTLEPKDLKDISIPTIDYSQGVVVEGRGPMWLYCFLVHELHPASWIGTYDPRLGVVVTASHKPGVKPGDVLAVELP